MMGTSDQQSFQTLSIAAAPRVGPIATSGGDAALVEIAPPDALGRPRRGLLVVGGTVAVGLGVVGIFVPLLPTPPFLLLAAACFVRSSDRLYRWLLGNRLFGEYIPRYREGSGVPLASKIAPNWR